MLSHAPHRLWFSGFTDASLHRHARPPTRHWVMTLLSLVLSLASPSLYAVSSITVHIGAISSPNFQASDLNLELPLHSGKAVTLKTRLQQADSSWAEASLHCPALDNPQTGMWRCRDAKLASPQANGNVSVALQLPVAQQPFKADLQLAAFSFSDSAGLHAGDKLAADVSLQATHDATGWRWQAALDWREGELFWQPFYFASGGHSLHAAGHYNAQALQVDTAQLKLNAVGSADVSGIYNLAGKHIERLALQTSALDLATLYPLLLKPLLDKTSLNDMEMAGTASLQLAMQAGELQDFRLDLQQADIADRKGKFALYKLQASIPWSYDEAQPIALDYAGGHLLDIPLGAAKLRAELERYSLRTPQLVLPILDGALTLNDVSAAWVNQQWHWHLRADLAPISMTELSTALGWPRMEGQVAAAIPQVTYSDGKLATSGAMQFKLFDGTVTVGNLAMQTPLGLTPRLNADVQFRNLDLGALTRTFAFGAIEGRMDGDVNALQLANWKPVQFDAMFKSSAGRYPRKISQRAVENISALGGAGAAAAVQRSVLRFFKEFNYARIGLTCRLRNGNCAMDGVDGNPALAPVNNTASGYVIVEGSGVPAITVLGYNHSVGWDELLARLQRITAGNSKPVIQ